MTDDIERIAGDRRGFAAPVAEVLSEIARIAAGLTKAQRGYLTDKAANVYNEVWHCYPPANTHAVLMRLRLVERDGRLTSLGLAVRAYLLAQQQTPLETPHQ